MEESRTVIEEGFEGFRKRLAAFRAHVHFSRSKMLPRRRSIVTE